MSRAENNAKVTHVRWHPDMDRILIDTLVEQIAAGNKGDNGWKSVAYQQVRTNMKAKLELEVSVDNVKNRLKTWKESYAAMSFLLDKSGFGRHPTNNTLTAPDSVWKEFLEHNPQYSKYRDKSLDNYDEIGIIVGNDQATGSQAQTAVVAESNLRDDDTTPDGNETQETDHADNGETIVHVNIGEATGSASNRTFNVAASTTKDNVNKRKRKNREDAASKKESMTQMAEGITSIANHMIQGDMKPDMNVLFESLRALPHITSVMRVKLVEYLVNDATKTKMFFMMKEDEQLDWCSIRFPAPTDG